MPKQDEKVTAEQKVQFVKEPPEKKTGGEAGRWANRLLPLLSKPNVWALVWTFDNPEQSYKLQSNLHSRQVLIPEPDATWEFVARGCEVYAIYRGKKRGVDARVRRANRRR